MQQNTSTKCQKCLRTRKSIVKTFAGLDVVINVLSIATIISEIGTNHFLKFFKFIKSRIIHDSVTNMLKNQQILN